VHFAFGGERQGPEPEFYGPGLHGSDVPLPPAKQNVVVELCVVTHLRAESFRHFFRPEFVHQGPHRRKVMRT
jgi:hypothetical protein